MESHKLLSPTKITRNTVVIIVIGVIVAPVIIIGVVNALITWPAHPDTVSSKQCGHTAPIRIFDEECYRCSRNDPSFDCK